LEGRSFVGKRDCGFALEHTASTGGFVRDDSERRVWWIEDHRISGIWMKIVLLGPSAMHSSNIRYIHFMHHVPSVSPSKNAQVTFSTVR
jgi:hypothetical protein